jgi:4-amino-4-deoxy-L-arabinose transferase-like glycosyltransferase
MKSLNILIFILVLLLQCVGIFDHSLWTPDEPREAQIIREMSIKDEYIIPSFAGEAFLEKPPLYYAMGVTFYRVLGSRFQEAGRMVSLFFALATLAGVCLTARRINSSREAMLAPLLLSTFPLFFLASHKILVDMGLVFFITSAMCSFIVAHHEESKAWYVVFWVSLACAFLCKGFIGLAIPGMALLVFLLWQRDMSSIRQAWVIPGIMLVTAVVAAWAGVLFLRGGSGYLHTFFIYNQIGRFIPAGSIYTGGHVRPFYYYLVTVPALTAPFSLLLIPAAATARNLKDTEKLLYSWLIGGLLILSISSTKREIYYLPMLPALAMIIAGWAARLKECQNRPWEIYFLKAVCLIVLLVSVILPVAYVKVGGSMGIAVMMSGLLSGLFWVLWRRFRDDLSLFAFLGWSLVFILWVPAAFPQVDKGKSYKEIFEQMGTIVAHSQAVGYNLTETVEGLAPFYGHFPVKNIEDRKLFLISLENHAADYIIVLPSRVDKELRKELAVRARPVFQSGGKMRREMEIWKMLPSPMVNNGRKDIEASG